jgi:hypothetical protein
MLSNKESKLSTGIYIGGGLRIIDHYYFKEVPLTIKDYYLQSMRHGGMPTEKHYELKKGFQYLPAIFVGVIFMRGM